MPPARGSKRRAGGRTRTGAAVAKKFLAACNGDKILPLSEHDQQVEYIEAAIQRLTQTVETQCDNIREEQKASKMVLERSHSRAKMSIPRMYREMNLITYCERCGEDYDSVLFGALTSKQKEALLARVGEEESCDENDENDPGTVIKGREPPKQVVPTPSAGSRQTKRPMRSTRKGKGPLVPDTPVANEQASAAAARNVPTTNGRGRRKGREACTAKSKDLKAGPVLKASLESVGAGDTVRMGTLGLTPAVIAELRKGANPNLTVYEHLDSIIEPRIKDVSRLTEERCAILRRKLEDASAVLRAKIPRKPPSKTKGAGKKKIKVGGKDVTAAAEATTPDVEMENTSLVSRSMAKVSLSAEGGPYNGSIFEVMLEEDGEARMLGRSTGKKFKLGGVSLRKDSEVSISHGKFENVGGKVTFTDVGSTNGTDVDGEQAEQWTAYEITTGSKLVIGQSEYTVTFTWEN